MVLTSAEPAPVLGPTGLGGLQLGMAKGDAMVSGELTQVPGEVGGTACAQYQLIKFPSTDGGYQVGASGTRGVEVIFAPPGVSTPEGIHLGSTLREARSAYPKLGSGGDFLRTPVPGQPDYVYLVGTGGGDTVVALALMLRDQTCIN
ncbi:hypothetical protein BJP25_00430 [Actinokineospora bangkokensis]|uniref:Uncharacterized protein n=1 Tax=Actinokineospora bangkokensis TaxID=1193682 RepID=A0A1Q9LUA6_9PSEU|nr:hypothetical protein BJP25_00430 [Actinokineospora bangkokensis]